ncbi:MAG: leucyl/phenylalanyl-tRNA--protein transferase [Vicinamibacteraceae bacterium]|nr:leucyl/phenylalanyl-tRNA--protein transferase [Vicinamibacteraceae bacterium]
MIEPLVLLEAYANGWFPMGVETSTGARGVEWFSPNPRGVLPLDAFHVPQRLARVIRQGRFNVRVDSSFERVMRECAARDETWITGEIVESYVRLHELGLAHSVEAWHGNVLVGGLYGVALRGAFFGESMFHREADASKVALAALVERLRAGGFTLLDIQWVTPHLAQFGAVEIPRRRYLRLLEAALGVDADFGRAAP